MKIPNLQDIVDVRGPVLRRPPPANWDDMGPPNPLLPEGRMFHRDGLSVILTQDTMVNGSKWLHVSCSRTNRLPDYDDLCQVKECFIGRQHEAVQVFAKEADHVNIHRFCLHLWSPA